MPKISPSDAAMIAATHGLVAAVAAAVAAAAAAAAARDKQATKSTRHLEPGHRRTERRRETRNRQGEGHLHRRHLSLPPSAMSHPGSKSYTTLACSKRHKTMPPSRELVGVRVPRVLAAAAAAIFHGPMAAPAAEGCSILFAGGGQLWPSPTDPCFELNLSALPPGPFVINDSFPEPCE